MTTTPNTPQELLELNQKQVFAEGLTNVELVERICHHSNLQPTDVVEVTKLLVDKLLTFHQNVTAEVFTENDNSLPADKMFWLQDVTKLQVVKSLLRNI